MKSARVGLACFFAAVACSSTTRTVGVPVESGAAGVAGVGATAAGGAGGNGASAGFGGAAGAETDAGGDANQPEGGASGAGAVAGASGNPDSGVVDLTLEPGVAWDSTTSSSPKGLGPTQDRFCALTVVSGGFSTYGAWVDVSAQSGTWAVSGSKAPWTAAEARCVSWPSAAAVTVEPAVVIASGSPPASLGSAQRRACFLVRVNAGLGGGGDLLRIDQSAGNLVLAGAGAGSGSAQCITWPSPAGLSLTAAASWSQGQPAVSLAPASTVACWLSGVTGKYAGGSEVVRTSITGADWYLSGASQQAGVGAWARCLQWP